MFRELILDDHVAEAPTTPPVAAPAEPIDITKINTLHELLAVAMRDFRQVLEDDRYRVNMGTWHSHPDDTGLCHVCLAGSVLAKTCKVPIVRHIGITVMQNSMGAAITCRMAALDALRCGHVGLAVHFLRTGVRKSDAFLEHHPHSLNRYVRNAGATNRRRGWALLTELHDLHRDLVAAGI